MCIVVFTMGKALGWVWLYFSVSFFSSNRSCCNSGGSAANDSELMSIVSMSSLNDYILFKSSLSDMFNKYITNLKPWI